MQEATQPLNSFPPTFELYKHITEIPLRNWISGTVDNNLSAIIKIGVCGDVDVLLNAWGDMRSQYAETIGDNESKLYFALYKEISRLSIQIDQVNMLVKVMWDYYTPQFARQLNNVLHTKFEFDVNDKEAYEKNLKSCISRAKGFKVLMDLKASQFEAISKKEKGGQIADHVYYQSVLLTLSQWLKYEVRDEITLFQYCELVKRLNNYLQQQEKK